jgi:hypothetical protein
VRGAHPTNSSQEEQTVFKAKACRFLAFPLNLQPLLSFPGQSQVRPLWHSIFMTESTGPMEQRIKEIADFLPQGRTLPQDMFDETLFQKLRDLESAAQTQPQLRDVFRKRCFDMCAFELNSSPLLRRIRYKPLGYAGDFEVFNMLFQKGEKTFWDAFIHRQQEVQDIGRMTLPANLLKDQQQTLLLLDPIYSRVSQKVLRHNLYILESEPKALAFAKTVLVQAHFYERLEPALHGLDLIYAPYLLHCLRQEGVGQVLQNFWQRLNPGGTLVLYHLQEQHTLRLFMQWCLDWTLEYHPLAGLETLARQFESTLTLTQQGIWWRLELKKSELSVTTTL